MFSPETKLCAGAGCRASDDGVLRRASDEDGVLRRSSDGVLRSRQRPQRGFVMIIALFIIVLLLAVGIMLLDNVFSAAANVVNMQQKNQIYEAAEAGLNSAIDLLDRNLGAVTQC